jgi:hypothetical protein
MKLNWIEMRKFVVAFCMLIIGWGNAFSQVGIGVYPSGNEPGFGFKTSHKGKWFADIRIADVLLPQDRDMFRVRGEVLAKRRFTYFERVNFVTGIGPRIEYSGNTGSFYGLVIPVAVEAFPFPFPNAGLFFEVGTYGVTDFEGPIKAGFRTVAGINFYFTRNNTLNE